MPLEGSQTHEMYPLEADTLSATTHNAARTGRAALNITEAESNVQCWRPGREHIEYINRLLR